MGRVGGRARADHERARRPVVLVAERARDVASPGVGVGGDPVPCALGGGRGGGEREAVTGAAPANLVCAICRSSSMWAGDFTTLHAATWCDGEGHHEARKVTVCTLCRAGDLRDLEGTPRLLAAAISVLFGGAS